MRPILGSILATPLSCITADVPAAATLQHSLVSWTISRQDHLAPPSGTPTSAASVNRVATHIILLYTLITIPAHENLLFYRNYLGNYSSLLSHRSFHQNSQLLKFSLLIDYCNYETVQTDVVNKDKSAYHIVACLPDGGLQTPPDSIFENYPSKVAAKNVKPL